MAIINSTAVGKATGSAGVFTYSTQEGRTIARGRSTKVRNPNTEAQQLQRSKMAAMVLAYRQFGYLTKPLFTKRKKYSSPYNAFVANNIKLDDSWSYDPDGDKFSLNDGFIFGRGSYPASTIGFNLNEDSKMEIVSTDASLLSNVKIGDTIGCFTFNGPSFSVEMTSQKVVAADLLTIPTGFRVKLDVQPGALGQHAAFWLSADGSKSTDCILSQI